jgi:serine/threonine protein phosphatase PrpC
MSGAGQLRRLKRTEPPAVAVPSLQVSTATDRGLVRPNNEDYVKVQTVALADRRLSIWAVADGVGGGPQGERASSMAVETVMEYLSSTSWSDPLVALKDAFALASRDVYEITGDGAAATTLVVALLLEPDGLVALANVGDSRAYLVTGGRAWQITRDHSLVSARVAAGLITAEEARTASDRNVLTRSVGSEAAVEVDVFGPRQLHLDERLVLCSDGIHGMIEDPLIGQLAGGLPIAASAAALVAAAVEAGGRDNATALVGGFESVSVAQIAGSSTAGTEAANDATEALASSPKRNSSEVIAESGLRPSPRRQSWLRRRNSVGLMTSRYLRTAFAPRIAWQRDIGAVGVRQGTPAAVEICD